MDPQLSMLTVDEAAEFRALVSAAFARAGRPVVVGPDHARDVAGNTFGLWNLASGCHAAAEAGDKASWPGIIAAHVSRLSSIPGGDVFEGLSSDEVCSRVYARLVASESLRRLRVSYAQEVAPGLSRLLAFDMPDSVRYLPDDEVERFGGAATLWEAGLANLRALPVEKQQRVDLPDGGYFVALGGDSVFTASRALVMEDLLRQMGQRLDRRFGVVVAIPHWTALVVHAITDQSALLSIGHVARFAKMSFADNRGPISPYAYWWRNGTWTQLSQPGPDGRTTVVIPGELSQVLEQLRKADARRPRRPWRRN